LPKIAIDGAASWLPSAGRAWLKELCFMFRAPVLAKKDFLKQISKAMVAG
jgi:hypothetical protein